MSSICSQKLHDLSLSSWQANTWHRIVFTAHLPCIILNTTTLSILGYKPCYPSLTKWPTLAMCNSQHHRRHSHHHSQQTMATIKSVSFLCVCVCLPFVYVPEIFFWIFDIFRCKKNWMLYAKCVTLEDTHIHLQINCRVGNHRPYFWLIHGHMTLVILDFHGYLSL